MRIGIVSDVHGAVDALEEVLGRFGDDEVDTVWCVGDIVTEYRFSSEAIRLLRKAGATAVRGNHDDVLLGPHGERARAGADPEELAWLDGLGWRHDTFVDGQRIRMVHGSPWAPHGDYVTARNPRWRDVDELGVDILVLGHTHEPMVERHGRTLVVNPGSLGPPHHHYAVLDTAAGTATIGQVAR